MPRNFRVLAEFYLGKGVKKPRFRKATTGKVFNRILMSILYGTNTKKSELANMVGVSQRSVHAWTYERNPSEENQYKVANALGFPKHILFFEHAGEEKIDIPFESKFNQKVLTGEIQNVILFGLMVLHDINHPDLARYLGYSGSLFRTHIHKGRIPPVEIQNKVCGFFQLPSNIIYNKQLFRRINLTRKSFKPYCSS